MEPVTFALALSVIAAVGVLVAVALPHLRGGAPVLSRGGWRVTYKVLSAVQRVTGGGSRRPAAGARSPEGARRPAPHSPASGYPAPVAYPVATTDAPAPSAGHPAAWGAQAGDVSAPGAGDRRWDGEGRRAVRLPDAEPLPAVLDVRDPRVNVSRRPDGPDGDHAPYRGSDS